MRSGCDTKPGTAKLRSGLLLQYGGQLVKDGTIDLNKLLKVCSVVASWLRHQATLPPAAASSLQPACCHDRVVKDVALLHLWVLSMVLLQVFFAILLAAVGVSNAQQQFPDVVKAKGAIRRVFGTLDRAPLIDTASAEGALFRPRFSVRLQLSPGL